MSETIESFLREAESTQPLKAANIAAGLKDAREKIYQDFDQGVPVEELIRETSQLIDRVLEFCFLHFIGDRSQCNCCLVAAGGYGRAELLPGSDIDLMLLLEKSANKAQQQQISAFLTFLWDIGLEVGHSVRTIRDCLRQGKVDVTVMSNMIESRLIYGNTKLYEKYQTAIGPKKLWSSRKFFEAKLEEQQERHLRYNDTAYNLEPNIKEGPGGLRDIQIIGWVARRHFGDKSFKELVQHGFLTEAEYEILDAGQRHLWRVRFALHRLAG
ncbi:MAG: [protein-PII] uridylyltransferase, partial [Gammaproteobacteria bacterium]|nr:[protein-PII] uridylyltransferase [Gammaproteobacteria bacterium]